MRLFNIHTRKLCEFMEGSVPPYTILSHRWTGEELTFKEVSKERIDTSKIGFNKLIGACHIAASYDTDYVWIDTCCIDKRSSAELSESINSMYAWYKKAKVCLVYLGDVTAGPDQAHQFRKSAWFTRSWTLQELLAPRRVEFYDNQWTHIGDKVKHIEVITDITSVDKFALSGRGCQYYSVATRMSWAADRCATRIEDVAYSLMGIFDVNIPLLYGEGRNAFRRLQEEVIRRTSDLTILYHQAVDPFYDPSYAVLASSPSDFRAARELEGMHCVTMFSQFAISNVGLEVDAELVRWDLNTFGILVGQSGPHTTFHAVLVQKMPFKETLYNKLRVQNFQASPLSFWQRQRRMVVAWGHEDQALDENTYEPETPEHGFLFRSNLGSVLSPVGFVRGTGTYLRDSRVLITHDPSGGFFWDFEHPSLLAVATVEYHRGQPRVFSIDLGFDFEGRPCCLVYKEPPSNKRRVLELSDTLPMQHFEDSLQEKSMVAVRHEELGAIRWFYRGSSSSDSEPAMVPSEMTGEDGEVWIRFVSDEYEGTGLRYWSFVLSPNVK